MNDRDFMRYSRQILLDDIALDGQQKLLDSQVLIIGLGGLGTPADKSSLPLKISIARNRRSANSD